MCGNANSNSFLLTTIHRDVQQANAVQDTDNLRCDTRYGCGDEAHVLANEGGRGQDDTEPAQRSVESTQIEYSVKSLLFFGQ